MVLAKDSETQCLVQELRFDQNAASESLMAASDEVAVIVSASAAAQTAFSRAL